MTLSGTESGVEALSDRDLLQYESYTTRARATLLPPTAIVYGTHNATIHNRECT